MKYYLRPFASLKRTVTPGTSFCKVPVFLFRGTPAISLMRMPQFHTEVTLDASTKGQASTLKKHENHSPPHRTHGAIKNAVRDEESVVLQEAVPRTPKKFHDQEDLSEKPLPLTSQYHSRRK